jgi:flagellin-like hook-associated protein FlgL
MQRLASGKQNIAPGDRTASSAVAFGMKAELASLKVGIQNGTEALNAIEMITNDIAALNDMVVRLEELNALGENGFNSGADTAALSAEAGKILTELHSGTEAEPHGKVMISLEARITSHLVVTLTQSILH